MRRRGHAAGHAKPVDPQRCCRTPRLAGEANVEIDAPPEAVLCARLQEKVEVCALHPLPLRGERHVLLPKPPETKSLTRNLLQQRRETQNNKIWQVKKRSLDLVVHYLSRVICLQCLVAICNWCCFICELCVVIRRAPTHLDEMAGGIRALEHGTNLFCRRAHEPTTTREC